MQETPSDSGGATGYAPALHELYFTFESSSPAEHRFEVVTLTGREAISDLFEFSLDLVSADPNIGAEDVLARPAKIRIERGEDSETIHGIVSSFQQGDTGPELTHYRVRVVPAIHILSLVRQSRIFQNMTTLQIVEEVLKGAGFHRGDDYRIGIGGTYPAREYTAQYQESDLDFIRRLLEHDGIFFFFDHGDAREMLVIADRPESHPPLPGGDAILFRDARGTSPGGEAVSAITLHSEIGPGETLLVDYNYRKPHLALKATHQGSKSNGLRAMEYGDHYKEPGEGAQLSKTRAEEIAARCSTFHGMSSCFRFRSGYRFTLQDHLRDSFNATYLLTEVLHHGRQMGVLGTAYGDSAERPAYDNRFTAILHATPFRPQRLTPKPRVHGIMNAVVDSSTSGQYADIDEMGRYRIRLFHDLSDAGEGKASRLIRMAQPYAGPTYGHHFPLHKGVEVLLTHVDGDPDRPIIAASVPNPANESPVIDRNHTQSVIRTAGQNEIVLEDLEKSERIHAWSPFAKSAINLGSHHHEETPPEFCPDGVAVSTEKGVSVNAGVGVLVAAGSANHKKGIESGHKIAGDVKTTFEDVKSLIPKGGETAKTGVEAMKAVIEETETDLKDMEKEVGKNGIYLSAPGKLAMVNQKATVIGSDESVSVMGKKSVDVTTPGRALLAGVEGAAVVARDDVEAVSLDKDVILKTLTKDVRVEAKTNITETAETGNITIEAKDGDIAIKGPKEMTLDAKNITESAVEKMTLKMQDLVIEATKSITITCGQTSIKIEPSGVKVNGTKLEMKATASLNLESAATAALKANAQLEVSSTGIAEIKGSLVKIN